MVVGRARWRARVDDWREATTPRAEARKEKRFAESDRLRDELKALGWAVEDTADGRRIKRI